MECAGSCAPCCGASPWRQCLLRGLSQTFGRSRFIMYHWVFGILKDYVMAWMEPQQVVDALMDANGEVMLVWHTANVLGDSGPTPRLSFKDQRTATLWCLRQRRHTSLDHGSTNERTGTPQEILVRMRLIASADAEACRQETQCAFSWSSNDNVHNHTQGG